MKTIQQLISRYCSRALSESDKASVPELLQVLQALLPVVTAQTTNFLFTENPPEGNWPSLYVRLNDLIQQIEKGGDRSILRDKFMDLGSDAAGAPLRISHALSFAAHNMSTALYQEKTSVRK